MIATIRDGTSNTFLAGEKHVPKDMFGRLKVGDGSIYNGIWTTYSGRCAGPDDPLATGPTDYRASTQGDAFDARRFGSWPPGPRGGTVNPRPRLLLIGPPPDHLNGTLAGADVESVPDAPAEVARRLRDPSYDGVVAGRDAAAGLLDRFRRDELILGHIDKGIAVLDPAGTVLWANPEFARWCGSDPTGRPVLTALGGVPRSDGDDDPPTDPLAP